MSTRQLVVLVVLLTLLCCGVMWALEDFRQRKLIEDFRGELANLPTYLKGTDA